MSIGVGRPSARREDMSGDPRKKDEKDILLTTVIILPFAILFTYLTPMEIDFFPRMIICFIPIYGVLLVNKLIKKRTEK